MHFTNIINHSRFAPFSFGYIALQQSVNRNKALSKRKKRRKKDMSVRQRDKHHAYYTHAPALGTRTHHMGLCASTQQSGVVVALTRTAGAIAILRWL